MSKIKKLIFLILFFVGIILLNTHVQASGDLYLKKLDFEATIYIAKFDKKILAPIEKDHRILWVSPLEYKDKLYHEYQRYILNKYILKEEK